MTRIGLAAAVSPRGRAAGRWLWLVFAAVVVALAGLAAVAFYSLARHDAGQSVPSSIAGLRLTSKLTGDAAVAEMSTMHQSEIYVRDGWVGQYERGAAVYVGEAESARDAEMLVRRMTERILESASTMFTHQGERTQAGIRVHVVRSGDQWHYYYGLGKDVIWIATPIGADPATFLDDAMSRVS